MTSTRRFDWRQALPAMMLAVAGSAVLIYATLAPRPGEPLVAIFLGSGDADQPIKRIVQAGWLPIRQVGASAYLIAPGSDTASIRRLGAIAVLSNLGLKGCS